MEHLRREKAVLAKTVGSEGQLGGGVVPWAERRERQQELAKKALQLAQAQFPETVTVLDAFSYARDSAARAKDGRGTLLLLFSPACDICEVRKPLYARLARTLAG